MSGANASHSPQSSRLPADVVPEHYHLQIEPMIFYHKKVDEKKRYSLRSVVEISLLVKQTTSSIFFHAEDLQFVDFRLHYNV